MQGLLDPRILDLPKSQRPLHGAGCLWYPLHQDLFNECPFLSGTISAQLLWFALFWVSPLVFCIKGTEPLCWPWSCLCRDLLSCSSGSPHPQAHRAARCERVRSGWSLEESSWDARLLSRSLCLPSCLSATHSSEHFREKETALRWRVQVGWAAFTFFPALCPAPRLGPDYNRSLINTYRVEAQLVELILPRTWFLNVCLYCPWKSVWVDGHTSTGGQDFPE